MVVTWAKFANLFSAPIERLLERFPYPPCRREGGREGEREGEPYTHTHTHTHTHRPSRGQLAWEGLGTNRHGIVGLLGLLTVPTVKALVGLVGVSLPGKA